MDLWPRRPRWFFFLFGVFFCDRISDSHRLLRRQRPPFGRFSLFFSLSAVSARLFFCFVGVFFLFYCFSFGRTDRRARINIFWVSSVCFLFAPVPRGVSLIRFLQQFSSTIVVSCFTIGRNKSLINGTNVSKKNSHVFVSAVLSVKEANVRPFGFRNVSVMKHWNVVLLRPHKVGLRSPFHLDSIT